jgi:hypothetical protein
MAMTLHMMCYEFASYWLRNPLQKWTVHLIHLTAQCKFWLFPKLKKFPERTNFADIQCNMMLLQGILENNFQDYFQQWRHRVTSALHHIFSVLKETPTAYVQVSKSCFHMAISGIKLSHLTLTPSSV